MSLASSGSTVTLLPLWLDCNTASSSQPNDSTPAYCIHNISPATIS
uniref:Uncharacterized protein n=1 Tax=Manihot esculenta TaxID=3983 RepID=A0A2C9WAR7_MANES